MTFPESRLNPMAASETIRPSAVEHGITQTGFASRILDGLARVTSSGRYIPVIDGLRFIAIISVVLFHLNESLVVSLPKLEEPARETLIFHILKTGNTGVPLFFAISGLILAMPFFESSRRGSSVSLGRYFLRRLTRLEPPYLINLALITCLLIVVNHQSFSSLFIPLLASAGYLHNVIYGTMSRINCVAWSLEIEVQFYILAPFIAWLLVRSKPTTRRIALIAAVLGLCLAKTALQYWIPGPPGEIDRRVMLALPYHFDYFLVGMLLADVYVTDWNAQPVRSFRWDLSAVAIWPLIVCSQWYSSTRHLLPFIILAAYYSTFRSLWLSQLLSVRWITVTGGMCYTLYLYHFFVISFVNKFTISRISGLPYFAALIIQILLIVPTTLIVGAVFFRLIERPFMVWQPLSGKGSGKKLSFEQTTSAQIPS